MDARAPGARARRAWRWCSTARMPTTCTATGPALAPPASRACARRSPNSDSPRPRSASARVRAAFPTWDQPASPCLSSRIPYGTAVTPDRLRRVERAESALRDLGIAGDLRVRDHDDLARVELSATELPAWLTGEPARALRAAVIAAGFARVGHRPRGVPLRIAERAHGRRAGMIGRPRVGERADAHADTPVRRRCSGQREADRARRWRRR